MVTHRRTSPWWAVHATIDVQEFATLEEAAAAENDGICRHDPSYNVRGGHGLRKGACLGRRCVRLRAECARREALRRRQAVRRGRCSLPLQEWDRACGRSLDLAPATWPDGVEAPVQWPPVPVSVLPDSVLPDSVLPDSVLADSVLPDVTVLSRR